MQIPTLESVVLSPCFQAFELEGLIANFVVVFIEEGVLLLVALVVLQLRNGGERIEALEIEVQNEDVFGGLHEVDSVLNLDAEHYF